MKNATKHAEVVRSLCKKLVREHKPAPLVPREPLEAMVRAAMSFDATDAKADDAMKAIERGFVDFNEFRVVTELEVHDLLGARYPMLEKRVQMITRVLNHIFEKEHTLNLGRIKELNRKDARTFLRALPDMHPFVEAYVMLHCFEGQAFPIDDQMLAYLREHGAVEADTSLLDAQKLVEGALKGEEYHAFYTALRTAIAADKKKAKA